MPTYWLILTTWPYWPLSKEVTCSLTHWGRVTHICVNKLTIIGSDDGLSPGRRQAIIWTNDGLLLIGPLGTNFSEILIEILTFSFKKMRLEVLSAKRGPFCLGLNVLKHMEVYVRSLEVCYFNELYNISDLISNVFYKLMCKGPSYLVSKVILVLFLLEFHMVKDTARSPVFKQKII